jgi:hypothetical protein
VGNLALIPTSRKRVRFSACPAPENKFKRPGEDLLIRAKEE